MCHKRNIRLLQKPEKVTLICLNEPVGVDLHPAKKKRKKDRLAGLKASAVLAANVSVGELESMLLKKMKNKKLRSELSSDFMLSQSVSTPLSVSDKETTSSVVKPVRPPVVTHSNAASNKLSLSSKSKKKLKNKKVADAPDDSTVNVVKKFKKGNKLTEMLAAAETAKQVQKKKPKNSLLASLELMLH